MRRFMRSVLVALLVAMMSFSPAVACHYCDGYGGGGYYSSGGYYGGGYVYGGCGGDGGCGGYGGCDPAYYESGCGDASYGNSCCGGEAVVSEGCSGCDGCGSEACDGCDGGCNGCGSEEEVVYDEAPMYSEEPMAAPAPPTYEPESTPSTVNRMPSEAAPALPPGPMPTPETDRYSVPSTTPATETLPPQEEAAPLPTQAMPPQESTSESLFDEPATPALEEPAPLPATEPAAAPSTPPASTSDDLFGEPMTDEKPLPVEEPATPAEAATDSDDLFGEPAAAPATEAPSSTPATDPAAEPSSDDLFGPPAEETPAEEAPPTEEKTEEADDLFGNTEAILEMPGGLASSELRQWVDNTGNFSCRGRLIRVLDGKVQLHKDNGRTSTVPLARLSQGDLEFVNRQASAQKAESLGKTAQVTNGWSN